MGKDIMSIRLSADGLSFWTGPKVCSRPENQVAYRTDDPARPLFEQVREAAGEYKGILEARGVAIPDIKHLYADTLRVVLVPEELFNERDSARYVGLHGMEGGEEMYTVCSRPVCATVAVMRLPRTAMEALGGQLGEFTVNHLLQYNMLCACESSPGIRLYLSPTMCHLTAYGPGGLAAAESYPYSGTADVLYYLSFWADKLAAGRDIPVHVRGDYATETAARISRTFKNTVCG